MRGQDDIKRQAKVYMAAEIVNKQKLLSSIRPLRSFDWLVSFPFQRTSYSPYSLKIHNLSLADTEIQYRKMRLTYFVKLVFF